MPNPIVFRISSIDEHRIVNFVKGNQSRFEKDPEMTQKVVNIHRRISLVHREIYHSSKGQQLGSYLPVQQVSLKDFTLMVLANRVLQNAESKPQSKINLVDFQGSLEVSKAKQIDNLVQELDQLEPEVQYALMELLEALEMLGIEGLLESQKPVYAAEEDEANLAEEQKNFDSFALIELVRPEITVVFQKEFSPESIENLAEKLIEQSLIFAAQRKWRERDQSEIDQRDRDKQEKVEQNLRDDQLRGVQARQRVLQATLQEDLIDYLVRVLRKEINLTRDELEHVVQKQSIKILSLVDRFLHLDSIRPGEDFSTKAEHDRF